MRKAKPKKRYVLPDPKFRDVTVTKFVNNMMYDGKKSLAYGIFYGALEIVEKRTSENGLEIWKKALNNVMPAVEVKSRRVGGATFQVPTEVRADRKQSLGMKWMINYARKRGEKTITERLAGEIIAASKGAPSRGSAAPIRTQVSKSRMMFSASFPPSSLGGISKSSLEYRIAEINKLAWRFPGTTAGPESPPRRIPSRVSSSKPP